MPRNPYIDDGYVARERESARGPTGADRRGWSARRDPFRGGYEERADFARRRGTLPRDLLERQRWEWPTPRRSRISEARRSRALADRDVAREVDRALYDVLGRAADDIAVLADDGIVTLEGVVVHPRLARYALETAWETPGVREVEDRLRVRR